MTWSFKSIAHKALDNFMDASLIRVVLFSTLVLCMNCKPLNNRFDSGSVY